MTTDQQDAGRGVEAATTSVATDPHAKPPRRGRGGNGRPSLPRSRQDLDVRFFSSASDAPVSRRPADVALLVLSILVLVLFAFMESTGDWQNRPLVNAIRAFAGLFGGFWEISYDLLIIWSVVLLAASVLGRHRLPLLRDQVLAAPLAVGIGVVACRLTIGEWPGLWHAISGDGPPATFPSFRVAIATAIIVTSSPHLGRPLRYFGRWVVAFGALAAIALETADPVGVAAGFAAALAAGAAIHLIFGSPGGLPTPGHMTRALRSLGVEAHDLRPTDLAPRGVAIVFGKGPEDEPLLVKVYGRDAYDGQFLSSAWSSIWYRDEVPRFTVTRLQQVEHEAFLTLIAERRGAPVLPIVAAGEAGGGDAILVLRATGRPMAELDEVTDDLLHATWNALSASHALGISHGQVDAGRCYVQDDGTVLLGELYDATVGAGQLDLLADRAQLLVSTAQVTSDERAVRAMVDALGPEAVTETLPFLQPAAMTPATKRWLRQSGRNLDGLRTLAAESVGAEVPKLVQLRRITWGSVLKLAAILLATYIIISGITGLGLDTVAEQFRNANYAWLWAAFFLAPVVAVADAFVTLGASIRPLRLGPVIALQLAIRFISLVMPTTAGRVALTVRFFSKSGLPGASAITVGALDGVSGFVVQLILLLVLSLSGAGSLEGIFGGQGGDGGLSWLIVVGLAVLIVGAVVAMVVSQRLRLWVRARFEEAREPLQVLRSPSKIGLLLGGNLLGQVVSAVVLDWTLIAFHQQASLGELLYLNTIVSMFAGFMPVPGGIGVYEAALTAGLVAIGIPEASALAIALAYRLVTYYLPPIYGGVAMRWLRQRDYL